MEFTVKTSVLKNVAKKLAALPDNELKARISRQGDDIVIATHPCKVDGYLIATISAYDIEGEIKGDDACVFSVARFKTAVLLTREEFTFVNVRTSSIVVQNGSTNVAIKGFEQEFFEGKPIERKYAFRTPAAMFAKIMSRAGLVAAQNGAYALQSVCICVEEGRHLAVATDGRRLTAMPLDATVWANEPLESEPKIPVYAAQTLQKLLCDVIEDVVVEVNDNRFGFSWDGFYFGGMLAEGRYPNWRSIIPRDSDCKWVHFNRADFEEAVDAALKLRDDDKKWLDIKINEVATFSIETETTFWKTVQELVYNDGAEGEITLDARFASWIQGCPAYADKVELGFQDNEKPAKFRIGDALYVVMPITKTNN